MLFVQESHSPVEPGQAHTIQLHTKVTRKLCLIYYILNTKDITELPVPAGELEAQPEGALRGRAVEQLLGRSRRSGRGGEATSRRCRSAPAIGMQADPAHLQKRPHSARHRLAAEGHPGRRAASGRAGMERCNELG